MASPLHDNTLRDVAPYDVAIVGLGPSGAVAAGLLGQAGLGVFVCDRSHTVYDKPRAIALDHEILRLFQQLGLDEAVAPHTEPFTDSCYYGVDGQLIRRMTMVAPPYPQGHVPSVVFSQPPVERVLRARLAALPTVTVATGWTLTGLDQDAEAATLDLLGEDGAVRQVRARYVVGCDGASSTVRGLLGIDLEDLDFDEPWLVVDLLANEAGLARLPATSVQYCEPDRPATFVIGPGNHRRWEISLKDGEDPREAATPEGTWRLLKRWVRPADGTLWRQASYRFHALVAARWRAGRIFIAGDAAHQQPPFLGQGMCQGIRDVANLAWKLARVLRGGLSPAAVDALLDSYGTERKAHVRALTGRLKEIGAVIGERDPDRARARDARLVAEAGGTVRPTPRQDVLPHLDAGLLFPVASAGRGRLFPQPWLVQAGRRVRMDAALGTGWRLVLAPGVEAPTGVPTFDPTVLRLGVDGMAEADGVLAGWFARHGCRAALVRPDHYVFGTARDPGGIAALLASAAAAVGDPAPSRVRETAPP